MNRRILLGMVIISLLFALVGLGQRLRVEGENRGTELIMDGLYLDQLVEETEVELKDLLEQLADKGLTGVAVFHNRIENLVKKNRVRLVTGNEVIRMREITGSINSGFEEFPYKEKSAFLLINDRKLTAMVLKAIPGWQEKVEVHYRLSGDNLIIFFPEWESSYLHLSTGFDEEKIQMIEKAGLKAVPRLHNKVQTRDQWRIIDSIKPGYIIFEGEEVVGYPDRLTEVARIMLEKEVGLGLIEPFIARQEGSRRLASLLKNRVLRVHSLQQEEMDSFDHQRIVNRYRRAVKERNVRILYLKPILDIENKEDLIYENLKFVEELNNHLTLAGFPPGRAEYFSPHSHSLVLIVTTALGIFAAGLLLLQYLPVYEIGERWEWFLLGTGILVMIFLYLKGYGILTGQMLALLSAIIFPSLAIISQLLAPPNCRQQIFRYLLAAVISLTGGILIAACLRHISFLLQVEQFRGVKLAFIGPLIIVSWYYFYYYQGVNGTGVLQKVLEKEIRVKHILLLLVLTAGGILYIGRTGNFPFVPVPAWEIQLREWLESFFIVRPRFKEFLIGHPALILALVLSVKWRKSIYFYPLLLLAAIGQVTMVNTLTHIHTPLYVSGLRLVHGLWLGAGIGFFLLLLIRTGRRLIGGE